MGAEILRIVVECGGKVPKNEAALARELAQICEVLWRSQPSDREMQAFIAEFLRPARNSS
jgi:hypothetical protein